MSNVMLTEKVDKAMSDLKKTMFKVESLRGNIGNLYKVGIPKDDPTDIKPFLKDWIYPKIEDIATELNSLMWKLDAIYIESDKLVDKFDGNKVKNKIFSPYIECIIDCLIDMDYYVGQARERCSVVIKDDKITGEYLDDVRDQITAIVNILNDALEKKKADKQKYQSLINEVDEILKQHKEKYGEN